MNTTVKLFDANNKLVPNFDEEIEKILISVHGDAYYDTDEELINTNEIPAITNEEIKEEIVVENTKKEKKKGVSFKDFIPVLFFILIFIVIVIAGYYFLNTVDLMSLVGASN